MEIKNTTPSKQFENQLSKSHQEAKSIHQTPKYMTAHFPCLKQDIQCKVAGLN